MKSRNSIKRLPGLEEFGSNRRRRYFEEVREIRESVVSGLRKLLAQKENVEMERDHSDGKEDDFIGEENEIQSKERFRRRRRISWAKKLMSPEWMVSIPEDLFVNWICMPRPEGIRCLIISHGGITVTRRKNGNILHKFKSFLPGGSPDRNSSNLTILDGIFQKGNDSLAHSRGAYYILDVLCWNGIDMCDTKPNFRFWWVKERLDELSSFIQEQKYHFKCIKSFQIIGPSDLIDCYSTSSQASLQKHGFIQDGILFYHKDGIYHGGVSPMVLAWKDDLCSPYFIDTDGMGISDKQIVSLQVCKDLTVHTMESIMMDNLSPETWEIYRQRCSQNTYFLHPAGLNRFQFSSISFAESHTPRLIGLELISPCSKAVIFFTW